MCLLPSRLPDFWILAAVTLQWLTDLNEFFLCHFIMNRDTELSRLTGLLFFVFHYFRHWKSPRSRKRGRVHGIGAFFTTLTETGKKTELSRKMAEIKWNLPFFMHKIHFLVRKERAVGNFCVYPKFLTTLVGWNLGLTQKYPMSAERQTPAVRLRL